MSVQPTFRALRASALSSDLFKSACLFLCRQQKIIIMQALPQALHICMADRTIRHGPKGLLHDLMLGPCGCLRYVTANLIWGHPNPLANMPGLSLIDKWGWKAHSLNSFLPFGVSSPGSCGISLHGEHKQDCVEAWV